MDEGEIREILGLPPHIRPVSILCVGKGQSPPILTDRMAIEEHMHQEYWE
jgi:FMN reductase (NADPH)